MDFVQIVLVPPRPPPPLSQVTISNRKKILYFVKLLKSFRDVSQFTKIWNKWLQPKSLSRQALTYSDKRELLQMVAGDCMWSQ